MSAQATDQATESRPRPKSRWRRVLAWVALVLGCLVLLIANVALFARILIFDTDTFADTLAPEHPDEEVIAGVADTLSDRIVTATAVEDRIQELTPRDNALVAATVTNAAENIIDNTVRTVMRSDRFRDQWREVVERAHGRFVALIEGDDREPVTLDLRPAVERVDQSLEDRGIDLIDDATVDQVGEVVALRRSQIEDVRETLDLVRRLVVVLPIVGLVLIAAAVALAPDRRRMLARAGVGIVVAMVADRGGSAHRPAGDHRPGRGRGAPAGGRVALGPAVRDPVPADRGSGGARSGRRPGRLAGGTLAARGPAARPRQITRCPGDERPRRQPSPPASPDCSAPTAPLCASASSPSPPEPSSCCPDRAR